MALCQRTVVAPSSSVSDSTKSPASRLTTTAGTACATVKARRSRSNRSTSSTHT
jgi:hypothetical protein